MCLTESGSPYYGVGLQCLFTTYLGLYSYCTTSGAAAYTPSPQNKPAHIVGMKVTNTAQRVYINGYGYYNDANTRTIPAVSRVTVGKWRADAIHLKWLGSISHLAIWKGHFSGSYPTVAKGLMYYSPLDVYRKDLVAYWPLTNKWGITDLSGNGFHLEEYGSPKFGPDMKVPIMEPARWTFPTSLAPQAPVGYPMPIYAQQQ